jgi:hypothetical protein
MTGISVILFGLNGVLYHYDRDAGVAHPGLVSGRSLTAIKAATWGSGFEDSAVPGRSTRPRICASSGTASATT